MVSAIFNSLAQSSLHSFSDFSFRSICYFNTLNLSPNSTLIPIPQRVYRSICFSNAAQTSNANFDLKKSGLNWSMFERWRWHVPWQMQTASLTSLAYGLSITTALILGMVYNLANIFQLLPRDLFGHDLIEPFDIKKKWILWEATHLMVASTGFSMSALYAKREFLCRFIYVYFAITHGSHVYMSSICNFLGPLVAHRRHNDSRFLVFLHSEKKIDFFSPPIYCSTNEAISKHSQLGYDPSEELFGIETDLKLTLMLSENKNSGASKPKSWFGPNGQYIKELPCPSCRGRGYTPCTECGIERSRLDCSQCSGKGIITCHQCLGECVIWEESIDEQPWEKARSISPLIVKEDDEVDNLEIELDKKKSKRVYQSPRPEVGQKISRSLKSLNAKTGLFSKRMKIIHRNPVLRAQRAAAIKKAKGTPAARKHTSETLKAYFSDPENRHKRSLAMKGVKFFCKNCGREGHRKHYCPELKEESVDRRFQCRICGEKGHNRRTCPKSRISSDKSTSKRSYHCNICHETGHNRRTCPKMTGSNSGGGNIKKSSLTSNREYTRACHVEKKGTM